jgi:hypothetical protein
VSAKAKAGTKAKTETKVGEAPPAPPGRNEDGFMVEDDGLVDVRLELIFREDLKIRVTPDVAKRLIDGEFDNQDPQEIPGVDALGLLDDAIIEVEQAYEGRPDMSSGHPSESDDDDEVI